jgi:ssDNA-binding Zn-finger/Zn-ribbon topoisomerase 1
MEHSTDLSKTVTSGEIRRIAMYACRPSGAAKSHYAYRALPAGEVVSRIGEGIFLWADAQTGKVIKTVRKKRALRKDRLMPGAKCQACGGVLIQKRGPWRHGQVKLWTAVCAKCRKRWWVDSHARVSVPAMGKGPRGSKETRARITIAAYFLLTNPNKTFYSMTR